MAAARITDEELAARVRAAKSGFARLALALSRANGESVAA